MADRRLGSSWQVVRPLALVDLFQLGSRHGPGKDSQLVNHAVQVLRPAWTVPSQFEGIAGHGSDGPRQPAVELTDFLAPAEAADEIGRLGPYRVLTVLGAGGMGVVFKALDPFLQRLVALKAMLPSLAASATARERFLREARAAAAIKHDHIVTIHQVGEDRGAPYLAMEFLSGEPLDERLKREGALPTSEVVRIGREIAEALDAAHQIGLIHRDIKPANIWLETRGAGRGTRGEQVGLAPRPSSLPPRVKLLDFGLARAAGKESQLTQQGAIIGTPAFMAPEQATGKEVDARCDLFSLGCVLYRMCTGELPFKGQDTISTLMAVVNAKPPPPRQINPRVPEKLAGLIMNLLEKTPADRPASAREVIEALQDMPIDKTAEMASAPSPKKAKLASGDFRKAKKKTTLVLVGAVVGLLVVAALVVVFLIPKCDAPSQGSTASSWPPRATTTRFAFMTPTRSNSWRK